MADSVAGEVTFLDGQEIVNNARTMAYLKAGLGPSSISVRGDCGCPQSKVIPLIGCDDFVEYTSPEVDPAPWYDSNNSESEHFIGFLMTSFEGLESTYTREVFPTIGGGGVLGRLKAGPRTLRWKGFLFGRTCCGTAYGLRWLTKQLSNASCGSDCYGERVDIMVCCPTTIPACGPNPSVTEPNDQAFRSIYNVGLLEGPLILSERSGGCTDCGCSSIMEIEFALIAGIPFLWKNPQTVATCQYFDITPDECPEWIKVETPEECESQYNCVEPEPCTTDPGCAVPVLPKITLLTEESCFCDPFIPSVIAVPVPLLNIAPNEIVVPVFQMFSGDKRLRSTRIRIYENPFNLACEDLIEDECNYCEEIKIRYVPAFSYLLINGVTKSITINCNGVINEPGEAFLVGNYTWPTLECINYCVTVEVDAIYTSSTACFSMSVVAREM